MAKDLISVIVPVYKVEKYLNRCVDSILNQTHKNLEVILVDDGSPDNCPSMCDEYAKVDKRVRVVHKANAGVSSARNTGLDVAKGDFVAFVDSDDWIEPTMYKELLSKQQQENYDMVFCKFVHAYDNGKKVKINEANLEKFVETKSIDVFFQQNMLSGNDQMLTSTNNVMGSIFRTLFKKTAINNIRFETDVVIEEDLLFYIQILQNNKLKLAMVDKYLYNYFMRSESAVHSVNDQKLLKAPNFVSHLSDLLSGTNYDYLVNVAKFNEYYFYYLLCLRCGVKLTSKQLLSWNTSSNYKAHKKFEFGFKTKLKYWLVHHKLNFIIKLLLKIKK